MLAPSTDTFGITVDDGAGGLLVNQSVIVNLTPLNQPPVPAGTVTVIEGETGVRLDNNGLLPTLGTPRGKISVSDPEGDAISTYLITTLPMHGTLFYDGTAITSASVGTPFVVSDISKLTYSHDGSETTQDSFDVTVSDNGGGTGTPASGSATIKLDIYPNDDDPVLATNVPQTLGSGCGVNATFTVTPTMLNVTDVDSPDTQLTYTVTGVPDPALGYFTLGGRSPDPGRLVAGTTFTQADIAAGRLIYVGNSDQPRTDSLRFVVLDGEQSIYPTQRDGGIYHPGTDTLTVNSFDVIIPPNVPPCSGGGGQLPDALPPNRPPVIGGSNSANLLEGGSETRSSVMLDASDPDNPPPTQLRYRLGSQPGSGKLLFNGAQLLVGPDRR